jgi:hypothetical protein
VKRHHFERLKRLDRGGWKAPHYVQGTDRMSDTPRTDAEPPVYDGFPSAVSREFARQLERENGQLSGAVDIWQKLADERKERIAAQSERLISLEKELVLHAGWDLSRLNDAELADLLDKVENEAAKRAAAI